MSGIVRRIHWAVVAAVGLIGLGCGGSEDGPKLYTVSGEVTYDNNPVEQGQILFRNQGGDGRAYAGQIQNGHYELKCEAGTMRVEITASRPTGKFKEVNPGEKDPVMEMYIPEKFNSKSTLEAVVKQESNEIPFHLKK
jgi:hypothetical protein